MFSYPEPLIVCVLQASGLSVQLIWVVAGVRGPLGHAVVLAVARLGIPGYGGVVRGVAMPSVGRAAQVGDAADRGGAEADPVGAAAEPPARDGNRIHPRGRRLGPDVDRDSAAVARSVVHQRRAVVLAVLEVVGGAEVDEHAL